MQQNEVPLWGNNIMLFNKEGEGLNKKKIRGHAFHMQYLLYIILQLYSKDSS